MHETTDKYVKVHFDMYILSVTPISYKNGAHTYIMKNYILLDMWFLKPSVVRLTAWKCHLRNKSSISDERARNVKKN